MLAVLITAQLASATLAAQQAPPAVDVWLNPVELRLAVQHRTSLVAGRAALDKEFGKAAAACSDERLLPAVAVLRPLALDVGRQAAAELLDARAARDPAFAREITVPAARELQREQLVCQLLLAAVDGLRHETDVGRGAAHAARLVAQRDQLDARIRLRNREIINTQALFVLLGSEAVAELLNHQLAATTAVEEPAPREIAPVELACQLRDALRAEGDSAALPPLRKLLMHPAFIVGSDAEEQRKQQLLADEIDDLLREFPDLDPQPLLADAAYNGNVRVVRRLLEHGAAATTANETTGETPLHLAVRENHPDCLRLLLLAAHDPDVANRAGETPLDLALANSRDDLAALIVAVPHIAADLAPLRTAPPADVPPVSAGPQAIAADSPPAFAVPDMLRTESEGRTTLHDGAPAGDILLATRLIKAARSLATHAVDVADASGRTPLHLAAENGQFMLVELLVTSGADPEARDAAGRTPLHLASSTSQTHAAASLLALGADPLARDSENRLAASVAAGPEVKTLLEQASIASAVVDKLLADTAQPSLASDSTASLTDAIVSVGHPDIGWITGFVISAAERMVATLADVSDLLHDRGELFVRRADGSRYAVERVLCHPGTLRVVPGNFDYLVRSPDTKDGYVGPVGPHVAAVRVADEARFTRELAPAPPGATPDPPGATPLPK